MKIIIYEDNLDYLDQLKKSLLLINGVTDEVITSFASKGKLLKAVGACQEMTLYILKINNEKDLKTAEKIRQLDKWSTIVLFTILLETPFLALNYNIEGLCYLSKARGWDRYKEVLTRAVRYTFELNEEVITVGGQELLTKEILYFETNQKQYKNVKVILTHMELDIRQKFEEIVKLSQQFIRTHQSYIVNVNQVKHVDWRKNEIHLVTGHKVYLSRTQKKQFRLLLNNQKS
jgi:DNA-binding LytR/AlgR family response regulator